jgi:hypothetical protein
MSDVIKDDDSDVIAAEFVLGTLDADERARAKVLLDVDHGFRSMVGIWERRFGELHLMVEPVEAAPQVWERIKLKIAGVEPSSEIKLPELPPEPEPEPAAQAGLPEVAVAEPAMAEPAATEPEGAAPELAEPSWPDRVRKDAGPPPTLDEVVAVLAPGERHELADGARRGLRRWRFVAVFMSLIVIALGGVIAAWRFAPERLPPYLRPNTVLQLPQPPPAAGKPPAPPGSPFYE